MKRVLFITNYASPYRVRFFDALAEHYDLTVLFSEPVSAQKHRDASWFVSGAGRAHFVELQKPRGKFKDEVLCTDVVSWLKEPYDHIVVAGYSSPTVILAMCYLRLRRIPFYMEVDGGLIRQDSMPARLVKKWLVTRPKWWISSGKHTTDYLVHYGAKRERVYTYPFSSLMEGDILDALPTREEKTALRQELGITEEKVILTVGQFIHRKGFDILMQGIRQLDPCTGVYFVGGEPTEEYRALAEGLSNVHFVGFRVPTELKKYYRAADVYVMPTREDIWGLVINEAMANGLPVVSTDRCVAALDLVEDGINGYIVPVEDAAALAQKLNAVLAGDPESMGRESLRRIAPYTIQNMVRRHLEIFRNQE